jgi:hypothetical protein
MPLTAGILGGPRPTRDRAVRELPQCFGSYAGLADRYGWRLDDETPSHRAAARSQRSSPSSAVRSYSTREFEQLTGFLDAERLGLTERV